MRWLGWLMCALAVAQTASQQVDVPGNKAWTDTGIDLRPGDSLVISSEGKMELPQGKSCGPEGQPRGFLDLLRSYPVNSGGLGALIGRIGSSDVAQPFLVGARKELQVMRPGHLFLGINQLGESIEGSFHVTVEFTTRGAEPAKAPKDLKLPELTKDIVDRIPRRVSDIQGNAGDNTNFVIVGNEQKVLQAFEAAGWVKVDRAPADAVLHGILAVLSKEAYLELPMSTLTLFGRPQDYGLAHAEPIAVVAQRHHLRLWKAPTQVEGQELWVGAATHDIGFDRDQRNGKVTHKIDGAIDDERDYVGKTLEETGLVAKLAYIVPSHPSKEARTATGGTFHSDGRVLVITLMPAASVSASDHPAR